MMNKKLLTIALFLMIGFIACQPDDLITPKGTTTNTEFVGKWNRDSVLVNLINSSGVKNRAETNWDDGFYTFIQDETGVLTTSGGTEFAITWFYDKDQQKITISEQDWNNQSYNVESIGTNKYRLTGIKFVADNNKLERIIYLSKRP